MRVLCRSGHFAFYPRKTSDISRFSNYFDLTLERERDYFTFSRLREAPKYSIVGKPFLNLPAIKTFSGLPWEVMKANNFVYHIATGLIVPKNSILGVIDLKQVGYYFLAESALVQPGMRIRTGQQILSYSGEFVEEGYQLRVLEYTYE
jgi:hypothetical protein